MLRWIVVVVMMCVFVGCRGKQPAGSQANQKNAPSGQETRTRPAAPKGKGSDSGDERTAPSHPTTGNAAPMPDSGLTDWASAMEYVPDYALLAAVVQPGQLLALPGVAPEMLNVWRGEAPFSPSQVRQLVACIYPDSTRNSLAVGWSIRLDPRVPRRIVGHWLSPGATPAPDLQRVYLPSAERGLCYGFPDEETVICGPYRYVYEVMGAGSARAVETEATAAPETDTHPLRRWLSTAPVGSQLAVVADVERLRHFAEHFRGGYPEDRGVDLAVWSAKLPQGWQHAAAAVDFAEADGVWAEVATGPGADRSDLPQGSPVDPSDVADRAAADWLEDRIEQAAQWLREQLAGDFHVALRQFDSEVRGWLAPLPWRSADGGKLVLKGSPPAAAAVLTTAADLLGLRDLVSAKQRVDDQASLMLVRVGQALQNFYTENGRLPQDLIADDGQPLLSWRVELLPWLNEAPLLQLFRFDEPWDSEHNRELLLQMPEAYRSRGGGETQTSHRLPRGAGTLADADEMPDGPERTLLLVESARQIEWTRPGDLPVESALEHLRGDGSWGVMGNLQAAKLPPSVDSELLRQLMVANDGLPTERAEFETLLVQPLAPLMDLLVFVPLAEEEFQQRLDSCGTALKAPLAEALQSLSNLRAAASLADDWRRGRQVARTVTPLLQSADADVRGAVLQTLRVWRREGVYLSAEALLPLLEDGYEANRWMAAALLADSEDPRVVRALASMPRQDVGVAQAILAGSVRLQAIAAESVIPLLEHENPDVRIKALQLVVMFGDQRHRPLLERAAADHNRVCREVAQDGLEQLTEQGPLEDAVRNSPGGVREALLKLAVQVVEDPAEPALLRIDLNEEGSFTRRLRDSDMSSLTSLGSVALLDLSGSFISAAGLETFSQFAKLQELELNRCPRIDDTAANPITKLRGLQRLGLRGTRFGDEGCQTLAGSETLEAVALDASMISDAGLASLAKLPALRSLSVNDNPITDRGLASLEGHPTLVHLMLAGTKVTDEGLKYLATAKQLEYIDLRGAPITAAGVQLLREAFPGLEIAVR